MPSRGPELPPRCAAAPLPPAPGLSCPAGSLRVAARCLTNLRDSSRRSGLCWVKQNRSSSSGSRRLCVEVSGPQPCPAFQKHGASHGAGKHRFAAQRGTAACAACEALNPLRRERRNLSIHSSGAEQEAFEPRLRGGQAEGPLRPVELVAPSPLLRGNAGDGAVRSCLCASSAVQRRFPPRTGGCSGEAFSLKEKGVSIFSTSAKVEDATNTVRILSGTRVCVALLPPGLGLVFSEGNQLCSAPGAGCAGALGDGSRGSGLQLPLPGGVLGLLPGGEGGHGHSARDHLEVIKRLISRGEERLVDKRLCCCQALSLLRCSVCRASASFVPLRSRSLLSRRVRHRWCQSPPASVCAARGSGGAGRESGPPRRDMSRCCCLSLNRVSETLAELEGSEWGIQLRAPAAAVGARGGGRRREAPQRCAWLCGGSRAV